MSTTYQKFAGACAILTGVASLAYLILFIILKNPAALLPSLALILVGIFSSCSSVYRLPVDSECNQSGRLAAGACFRDLPTDLVSLGRRPAAWSRTFARSAAGQGK